MLMPSIFGENLFNDDWMNFGFPEVDKALYGKYQLTEVTIAVHISKIGDYAFANCKNLTTVTIKNDKCHIDSSSFENCPISSFKFG